MQHKYAGNFDDEPEKGSDDEKTEATALLSKSILMGKECKVGDTVTLKVTAIHDDEIMVERAGNEEPEPDETEETPEVEGEEKAGEEGEMMPAEMPSQGNYD